ncbi:MAG: hypothetical protein GY749_07565 [Desulfobacteraceae bacterium]|nr:hypothetical protein [Desulfobacteraceae bacterium]
MQQVIIHVPDSYPRDRLREKISEIEEILKNEAEALLNIKNRTDSTDTDSWETFTADGTGRTHGYVSQNFEIPVKSNSKYLFLNDDVWDGESTPTDLAENHDDYLYNEEL